jgi:IMP dehydrogenase
MYRGMASSEAQIQWRGKVSSLEGVSTLIEAKGDATQIINNLERGIRSGLSYSGARTVGELQCKSEFVYQTAPGAIESTAHINRVN